ncbi:hypothetical protein ACQ5SO_13365 [Rhodovulum sp. DZ06]|uniref:hypothetical protein n=1 Tax=Rhodovulum sp. DZ06 TaxID=3425126 RepID=UPI003D3291CE
MSNLGVPDLLSNQLFRLRTSNLSRQLASAGRELTTGQREDLSAAAGGDMRKLYLLETGAASKAAFSAAARRAGARAETTLNAIEQVRASTDGLAVDIEAATQRGDLATAKRHADTARNAFGASVRALNTRYAGRSLFAGANVGEAALKPPEEILDAAFTAVSGAADAADMRNQLRDWFLGAGGGYETDAYNGDASATRMQVNDGEYADFDVSALDIPFRRALFGLALAVGTVEGRLPQADADVGDSLSLAAASLIGAQPGLVDLSADMGGLQEQAVRAETDAETTRTQMEMRLNDVVGIDPYEAASRLTGIQGALETALTVQNMTRSLSFVRFIQ